MGHDYGRITAPVNTDDVAAVIGENSHDVATLCMSRQINKWAKYKPEIWDSPATLPLSVRKNNNFGLVVSATYTSRTAFINAVKAGTFTGGWTYNQPGTNNWKRLDDFVGYNHGATSPFGTLYPFTGFLSTNTLTTLLIPADSPQASDGGDDMGVISIKDMTNANADYSNWYFGILLYSTSRYFMATTAKPFSQVEDWQVDFGWINPSYAGTYKGVPFISSKPFTVSGSEPSDCKIVGIGQPGVNVILKKLSQMYIPFATCCYVDNHSPSIRYEASITNTGTTAVTLTNVVLQVAYNKTGLNASTLKSFGSVTIAAGTRWSQSGNAVLSSRSFQFCKLTYNGSSDSGWVNFEEIDQGADGPDGG